MSRLVCLIRILSNCFSNDFGNIQENKQVFDKKHALVLYTHWPQKSSLVVPFFGDNATISQVTMDEFSYQLKLSSARLRSEMT